MTLVFACFFLLTVVLVIPGVTHRFGVVKASIVFMGMSLGAVVLYGLLLVFLFNGIK